MPKDATVETSEDPYRLPRSVLPSRYDLRLEPDLDAGVFAGEVIATVDVVEPTATVMLNAADLQIEEAFLDRIDGSDRVDPSIDVDTESERLSVHAPAPLDTGVWRLHLRFRGELNDKLK